MAEAGGRCYFLTELGEGVTWVRCIAGNGNTQRTNAALRATVIDRIVATVEKVAGNTLQQNTASGELRPVPH